MKTLILVLCLVVLLLPSFVAAQSTNATITGRIADPSKAMIPGVRVTAINTETNARYEVLTNNSGSYVLPNLPPGPYRLEVERAGFKTIVETGIVLHVQDTVQLNYEMALGAATESVTVRADQNNINTTDGTVSTVVDHMFVERMPLNGRSFQSLLALSPGVGVVPVNSVALNNFNGIGYSGEVTVNGQRTEANYFMVDGVSANTGSSPGNFGVGAGYSGGVAGESALGTTQTLVSIDALQEFRASTSTYSAEYGRTPGGQFSFATRAGTNDFHGSLYDYLRNDVMDANNWFNNAATPQVRRQSERQNDFGGTLGGPVIIPGLYRGRDRTFFFFSFEGLRLLQPQAVTQFFVPDATLRQSAPAPLQPVLNAFPVPNGGEDGLNDGLAIFNEAVSNPSNLNSTSVRIDHRISDKFKIFGRYAYTPSDTASFFWAVKSQANVNLGTVTLGATSLISSRQSNEFRFNYTRNDTIFSLHSTNLGGATPFDLSSIPGPGSSGFPSQGSFLFVCVCYGGFPQFQLSQLSTFQRQLNITDNYTWMFGRHNIKAGLDWRRIASRIVPRTAMEFVEYFSQKSLLANSAEFVAAQQESSAPVQPIYTNWSSFVQDDWRVSQRLSLSLGLRWDVNPAPTNAMGPSPYTVTQITNIATTQLAPTGTPLWKTDWHGIAPRVGLAYQIHQTSGRETVLRGGFGVYYDMGNTQGSQGFGGPGFKVFVNYPGNGFPLSSAQLALPAPSVAPPYNTSVFAFDPNLVLPYTMHWNVTLEQALGRRQALTMGYVGSAGRDLLAQFRYIPRRLGNPNFSTSGALFVTSNRGSSRYDSLQIKYRNQLSHGLQASVAYTWSHAIDDASSNFQIFELQRSSADFDIRHNFQAALTYDIPKHYQSRALSAILGNWAVDSRISARSALPVDVLGPQAIDPSTGVTLNFHPNLVTGQPLYVTGPQYPGGRAINFNAFQAAPVSVEGNTPRNYARGFDAVQVDLALRREFPVHERVRLQLRGEAFNLFNHPIFGATNNKLSVGAARFGLATGTLNGALGGLNPLYQTGGPRSLQVMLRLAF